MEMKKKRKVYDLLCDNGVRIATRIFIMTKRTAESPVTSSAARDRFRRMWFIGP